MIQEGKFQLDGVSPQRENTMTTEIKRKQIFNENELVLIESKQIHFSQSTDK